VNAALFILYFIMVIRLLIKKRTLGLEALPLILMIGCLFHSLFGNHYGYRFYYEGYLLGILIVIGECARLDKIFWRRLTGLLILAGFLSSLLVTPSFALQYWEQIQERNEVYRLVNEKHIANAIVIIPVEGVCTYLRDFIRNDPDLQNSVLYVVDGRSTTTMLLKYFPHKDVFRYLPLEKEVTKRLQKV
jgi:hypothetical protein